MIKTVLIVPAWSDQASQCRIVMRDGKVNDALAAYRHWPDPWKEIGLIDSRGLLVCCDEPVAAVALNECGPPLYAPLVVYIDA